MLLTVKSMFHDYSVIHSTFDQLNILMVEDEKNIFVIDSEIVGIYNKYLCFNQVKYISFFAKERNKTIGYSNKILRSLLDIGIKRNYSITCIGGGISQDVCGFISSIIFRGIQWNFIPTTLLSQADSCIGGKTSLNFDNYKNIIGSFYPPQKIFMIPEFILTLKTRDYYSGIGELVKMHIIGGEKRINHIMSKQVEITQRDLSTLVELIFESLRIKSEFIQTDEFDHDKRLILNYGHTLGHALETMSNYKIPHGQAVIFGIIFSNIISVKRKLISRSFFDLLNQKLLFPYIKTRISFNKIQINNLIDCIKLDKKQTKNNITMVLLSEKNGLFLEMDLTESELIAVFNEFRGLLDSISLESNLC